ncbi:hypothetical protein C8J57DRAFT_1339238 [Mycena rebaudengoi]|nr:hypothetical protein C8J57DRAFT_1339238 [Mycena rebaudengoi]
MRVFFFLALLTYHFSSMHVLALVVRRPITQRDPLFDKMVPALWIWAGAAGQSKPPLGNVAFMRSFSAPAGKTPDAAEMTISAVNNFTVWVNGNPIGSSTSGPDDWKSARVFRAALNTMNLFSILASASGNTRGPLPGLLAAITITYKDGSFDRIFSDSSWAVTTVIPADFPTPADTTQFVAATLAAPFGSGSWGKSVTVPPTDPNALELSAGSWIWTTPGAAASTLAGIVGFRKTVATARGKIAQSAIVLLTFDNSFSLYVNGKFVGKSPAPAQWSNAQQFTVPLNPAANTFNVIGQNFGPSANAGGFIAAIKIIHTDGTSQILGTDATWLHSTLTAVSGDNAVPRYISTFLSTRDQDLLSNSAVLGRIPMAPWGANIGTFNALAAAAVPVGPFVTSSPPPPPSSRRLLIIAIIGGVVGGLAVVGLVLALAFWWRRRRNSSHSNSETNSTIIVNRLIVPSANMSQVDVHTPLLQVQPYRTPSFHKVRPSASEPSASYPMRTSKFSAEQSRGTWGNIDPLAAQGERAPPSYTD